MPASLRLNLGVSVSASSVSFRLSFASPNLVLLQAGRCLRDCCPLDLEISPQCLAVQKVCAARKNQEKAVWSLVASPHQETLPPPSPCAATRSSTLDPFCRLPSLLGKQLYVVDLLWGVSEGLVNLGSCSSHSSRPLLCMEHPLSLEVMYSLSYLSRQYASFCYCSRLAGDPEHSDRQRPALCQT